MRDHNRLTPLEVKRAGIGRHHDGGGLYLVAGANSRSWIFRWRDRVTGKLRDHGLGPAWDISLAEARAKAKACRELVRQGGDPIGEVRDKIAAQRVARAKAVTFAQCAAQYIEAHRAGWRNAKHADQWVSTLETYAAPINALPVSAIDTGMVLKCLQSEWATKAETMTRVRQRIEAVLDWATVRSYRKGDNPARWKGHLDKLLPKRSKVQTVEHRAALPYADAAQFLVELRQRAGLAARTLELQILTATRPGEAAGAQWSEIDLDAALWIIPAARMKADVEHRVPLSAPAVRLLRSLPRDDDNVFPGVKGRTITTASAMKLLHDLRPGITAHGLRSSFRDWAGESTGFAREVVEAALAHRLKDKAEAAYRRGDALARRRHVMDAWAKYLDAPHDRAKVTPIKRAAK